MLDGVKNSREEFAMKMDVTGKKELASLKFDWKIYQLHSVSTKCCAGGTIDETIIPGIKHNCLQFIPNTYDTEDIKKITSAYGYLRS